MKRNILETRAEMKLKIFLSVLIFNLFNFYAFADDIKAIKNTKRVSVVYVGTSGDISASSFGHLALRLSPSKRPSLGDAVVEFVADVPEDENPVKKYTKGIGLPNYAYPVVAKISPFYDFKKINQLGQDRDVSIYELDMTQAQIDKFIDLVINYKKNLSAEDYTFFKKNCSYFSLVFLEKAMGVEIDKKSYPWIVKDVLEEIGLVSKKILYPRGSKERLRTANMTFEKYNLNESFPDQTWSDSFVRMIQKNDYHYKISAYLKLLATFTHPNTTEKTKKRITSLMRKLKKYELSAIKFVLGEFFKSSEDKKIISLKPQKYSLKVNSNITSTFKHEMKIEGDKIVINVKVTQMKARMNGPGVNIRTERKKFIVPDLKFDLKTKAISYKGIHIGREIKSKKLDFILTQRLDYGLDINEKKKTISPMIYLDLSNNIKSPKLSYEELRESGTLALDNMKDFKGTGGTCRAMVNLQKALTERAIFLADGEYDSSVDKIELLKAIYDGSYAVISGYKGIRDFTASIDKEKLKAFVVSLQYERINKSMQEQVIENVQHQTEFKEESFLNIKGMLKEGLLLPVDVGIFHKGTWMWVKNTGHSLLIYDIEDNGDGRYKVTAYDPNYGVINKLYKLNDRFMLEHVLYQNKYDYRAGIPKIEKNKIELDNAVRSRKYNYKTLKFSQEAGMGTTIVPSHKVHRLLE